MKKELKDRIKEINKELILIPELNNGGCGFVAYEYDKKLGYKKIVIVYWNKGANNHYLAYGKRRAVDSKDVYNCNWWNIIRGYFDGLRYKFISVEELERELNNRGQWNSKFNRKYVKTIKNIIDKL